VDIRKRGNALKNNNFFFEEILAKVSKLLPSYSLPIFGNAFDRFYIIGAINKGK
jgi:hypothetical protein